MSGLSFKIAGRSIEFYRDSAKRKYWFEVDGIRNAKMFTDAKGAAVVKFLHILEALLEAEG